jgi:PAS domain S-box-containing protein
MKDIENLTKEQLLILLKEQKTITKSLKHSDKEYKKLLDNSIDGIYKSTLNGMFIEVNEALVKMLGYDSKEELLKVDVNTRIYLNKEDRLKFQLPSYEIEAIQVVKKDGSIIWVEDYGKNITNELGEIVYHEGIIRDVTEIKKSSIIQNVLLKISQAGYRTKDLNEFNEFIMNELGRIVDTTNFCISFYNEENQTIDISFITRESTESVDDNFPVGKSITGYLIKKKVPLLIKSIEYKKLIDSGEIQLNGTIPASWLGVPLRVDNKVIGAIVVQSFENENAYQQNDIELLEFVASHIGIVLKRKKYVEEIAVSKEVLRKVLDNIPIRVFWKDKESRFLGCNAAFLKEMSIESEKELLGKTDLDIHKNKEAEQMVADELEIMLSGQAKLNYEELITRTDVDSWLLVNKLPFYDKNNNVIGIIGTAEDITERREMELKLKAATEEAIAANLSKSVFLSNMSHEIRTPMNAILGYSQLLQDDDNLTKVQQESLKTINKSGEHLLALINDILDMSKIEAGRTILKPDNFNFVELLKEVEQLFKIKAAQKKIELSFLSDDMLPKYIYADESKIKQVIINLLGNAIKFTSEGFVEVSAKILDNNVIEVQVKDSGKGILKEEQELIFKPFEQAQKGRQIEGGTGLGLAISKKFANLMEGDIFIESELEKGSIFTFTFKHLEGKETVLTDSLEELQVVSLRPEMMGYKVAIVDDRFENRDILYKKLNPLGFDIRMAENGLEAVELYQQWKPDLILMDVVMPIMDGVEATRKILEIAGNHDVKIFVISASALESEQKEVMDIGATVFIKKPVMFNLLLAEMRNKAGIKFIYNKTKEVVVNTPIASDVPEHLKIKFLEASAEGDFMLLQDLLVLLEKETNKPFKYVEECINEMEFEEIINWFES